MERLPVIISKVDTEYGIFYGVKASGVLNSQDLLIIIQSVRAFLHIFKVDTFSFILLLYFY